MPFIIGSVIGAVGGIAGSAIEAAAQKKIAKRQIEAAKTMEEGQAIERTALGQKADAAREISEEQRTRTESARLGLFTSLGAPGTYDPQGPGNYQMGSPQGLSGLYGLEERQGQVSKEDIGGTLSSRIADWKTSGRMLNVDQFLQTAQSSTSFRVMSKMVAESEQLLNQEGPLWDGLTNPVLGGILERGAAAQREMMDTISRDMSRGGSARRQGLATAQKLQAQEAINRQVTQETWQAGLAITQYARQYAANTQALAQDWVNNHDGVRDQFSNALSQLTNFWTTSTMPHLMTAASADYRTSVAALQPIMAGQREQAGAFAQVLSLGISGIANMAGSKIGAWAETKADAAGGWVGSLFGSDKPGFGRTGTTVSGLPWQQ